MMSAPTDQFKRILIPVEDLEHVEELLDFISNHHWPSDVQFKVLHVLHTGLGMANMTALPVILPGDEYQEEFAAARQLVNSVARRLDIIPNKSIETLEEDGSAREVILTQAREWQADMILMVSHGRYGLDRWLMGSTSGSVADHSNCSIVILHAKDSHAAA